ncbi:MAG TPA: YegS/Rv2252/BmrU family lipid kinase [Thermoanaerobaculia bacterium]|nr:YegS/Rv2252/BmrU family lipid kinase [Thermoanaerobaculia bacterium]
MNRLPAVNALFLVNERSGKRRDFDLVELIHRASPFEHRIVSCSRKEDVDAIVDDAERDGVDVIYAVGGDGTVHETAKRLVGRKPALGILPIGSGNGFARHIGLPADPAASLQACKGGRIETIDTAIVNGHPFLGVMGIGFDAMVADRFASSQVRGLETYVKEGLRAFAEFKAERYAITANGETQTRAAFVVAVANSGQYGNNARIAPLASLQDGLLDVVIIDDTRLIDAAFLLARLFHGSLHRAHGVTMLQTAEVVIRREQAGPAHLDGEPVTLEAELRVRVKPGSLRLLVPDHAANL